MVDLPHSTTRVHVLFRPLAEEGLPRPVAWLMRRCLHPKRAHVALLWHCPVGDAWVYVEGGPGGVAVFPFIGSLTLDQAISATAPDALDVVPLDIDTHRRIGLLSSWRPMLGFVTCVTIAKRILGVHGVLIQTPHQLYKALTR